jgi:carbamate kinase
MRVLIALGGNALIQRGQKPDSDVQQANILAAADAIDAACTFAELTGDTAYIGALQDAPEILQDKAGARISART